MQKLFNLAKILAKLVEITKSQNSKQCHTQCLRREAGSGSKNPCSVYLKYLDDREHTLAKVIKGDFWKKIWVKIQKM